MAEPVASYTNQILPIVTLLIGYVTKSISDWLDFRRVSKREREAREQVRRDQLFERRSTFQRQTLLDLQEAMMDVVRTSAIVHHRDVMEFQRTKEWQKTLHTELSESNRMANARVTLLSVRVRDQSVRDLARELRDNCSGLIMAKSKEASDHLLEPVLAVFDKLNERIGELVRNIDEQA